MKKIISFILCITLLCSFTACNTDSTSSEDTTTTSATTTSVQTTSSNKEETASKPKKPSVSSKEETKSQVSSVQGGINIYHPDIDDEDFVDMDDFVTSSEGTTNFPTKSVYKISTAKELKEFADAVNSGYAFDGVIGALTTDIDLAGIDWEPIGTSANPFRGLFTGSGYTIKNLTIKNIHGSSISNGSSAYIGLFGFVEDSTIKDLHLENVDISIRSKSGLLSVTVGSIVGNMLAYDSDICITNCSVTGNIDVSLSGNEVVSIGGVVGQFYVNNRGVEQHMQYVHSAVNIKAEGFVVSIGGISATLSSRDNGPSGSNISDLVYIGHINDEKVKRSHIGGLFALSSTFYRSDIKNCFVKLSLSKTGRNQYTELSPIIGIAVGDQATSTKELGLSNIYGCVYVDGNTKNMSFVGRKYNTVYSDNCIITESIPEDAISILTNWNLSDKSYPTFKTNS